MNLPVFQLIESRMFERLVYDYLDDDSYSAMQTRLAQSPEAGDLIRDQVAAASGAGAWRPRQARRSADHLLRQVARWAHLAVDHVWQGWNRKHSGPFAQSTEGGVRRWRK